MNQQDLFFHAEQTDAGGAGETTTHSSPIHRQWPSLGRELFALEEGLATPSVSNQRLQTEKEHLRQLTLAQLYQQEGQYSRATRYLAFLLVKYGRGGAIVGNPLYVGKDGARHVLPYTGLEGYYAGSEQTAERPGLLPGDILQEEAEMGAHLLKTLKRHAVEQNSWTAFFHIRHTLEGKEQDREAIQTIQTLWAMTTGQLRSRVYHNPEFKQTLTEQIDQAERACGQTPKRTAEDRHMYQELQAEAEQLKEMHRLLGEMEKAQERTERARRERLRVERLAAFQLFREETYQILEASGQGRYDVGIQDHSWNKATILETIVLPNIPAREMYPSVQVQWPPEDLDGYLFLAALGEIGADPLARSELLSQEPF